MQRDRLGNGAARDEAFRQALGALDAVSRLASDAERLIDAEPLGDRVGVRTEELVARVLVHLPPDAVASPVTPPPPTVVAVPPDVDVVAQAIASLLLGAADPPPAAGAIAIGLTADEIWFAVGAARTDAPAGEPLDHWSVPGLAWPAACYTVDRSGGRLWTSAGHGGGVGVAFPLEVAR